MLEQRGGRLRVMALDVMREVARPGIRPMAFGVA
jgi:hypothetical protein